MKLFFAPKSLFYILVFISVVNRPFDKLRDRMVIQLVQKKCQGCQG